MRKWQGFALSLALALGAAGCATWTSPEEGWPVPQKVDPPKLERQIQGGIFCWQTGVSEDGKPEMGCLSPRPFGMVSMADETVWTPAVTVTEKAWAGIEGYVEALRQGWCEGRYALQIANGEEPERLPLCEPEGP